MAARPTKTQKFLFETLPWKYSCFGKTSEIEARIDSEWLTIATVHSLGAKADAEDIAAFILRSINDYAEAGVLLDCASNLLSQCQDGDTLQPAIKRQITETLIAIHRAGIHGR